MSTKKRVCVIGAGPCGMSALFHFGNMEGVNGVDVVCFEKQSTWGGLWNLSWRTGTDEFGEHCHAGMYKHMWSNGPKECLEFPDYTFEEHYGTNMPSFPPRQVLQDYLEGKALFLSRFIFYLVFLFTFQVKFVLVLENFNGKLLKCNT